MYRAGNDGVVKRKAKKKATLPKHFKSDAASSGKDYGLKRAEKFKKKPAYRGAIRDAYTGGKQTRPGVARKTKPVAKRQERVRKAFGKQKVGDLSRKQFERKSVEDQTVIREYLNRNKRRITLKEGRARSGGLSDAERKRADRATSTREYRDTLKDIRDKKRAGTNTAERVAREDLSRRDLVGRALSNRPDKDGKQRRPKELPQAVADAKKRTTVKLQKAGLSADEISSALKKLDTKNAAGANFILHQATRGGGAVAQTVHDAKKGKVGKALTLQSAAKGFVKNDKTVSKELGIKNPVLKAAVDVASDPATYVTFGASAPAMGAARSAKALATADAAKTSADALKAGVKAYDTHALKGRGLKVGARSSVVKGARMAKQVGKGKPLKEAYHSTSREITSKKINHATSKLTSKAKNARHKPGVHADHPVVKEHIETAARVARAGLGHAERTGRRRGEGYRAYTQKHKITPEEFTNVRVARERDDHSDLTDRERDLAEKVERDFGSARKIEEDAGARDEHEHIGSASRPVEPARTADTAATAKRVKELRATRRAHERALKRQNYRAGDATGRAAVREAQEHRKLLRGDEEYRTAAARYSKASKEYRDATKAMGNAHRNEGLYTRTERVEIEKRAAAAEREVKAARQQMREARASVSARAAEQTTAKAGRGSRPRRGTPGKVKDYAIRASDDPHNKYELWAPDGRMVGALQRKKDAADMIREDRALVARGEFLPPESLADLGRKPRPALANAERERAKLATLEGVSDLERAVRDAERAHGLEKKKAAAERKAHRQYLKEADAFDRSAKGYWYRMPASRLDDARRRHFWQGPDYDEAMDPGLSFGESGRIGGTPFHKRSNSERMELMDPGKRGLYAADDELPAAMAERVTKAMRAKTLAKLHDDIAAMGTRVHSIEDVPTTDRGIYEGTYIRDAKGFKPVWTRRDGTSASVQEATREKIEKALREGKEVVTVPRAAYNRAWDLAGRGRGGFLGRSARPGPPMQAYDRLQGNVKTGQTVINPGYHMRNLLGDAFNARLGGATTTDMLAARRMLRRERDIEKADEDLARSFYGEERRDLNVGGKRARVLLGKPNIGPNGGGKIEFYKGLGREAEDADIVDMARELGAIQMGFAGSELRTLLDLSRGPGKITEFINKGPGYLKRFKGMEGLRDANELREDLMRLATFRSALKRGMDPESAARHANRYHFDYGNLNEAEIELRRLIPFYTFASRNLALQSRSLLESPGRYATLEHVRQDMAEGAGLPDDWTERMPEYIQKQTPIPIPGVQVEDAPLAVNFQLPVSDLNMLNPGDAKAQLLSRLTTPGKVALEQLTNYNSFYDEPRRSDFEWAPRGAQALGLTMPRRDRREGDFDPAWSWRLDNLLRTVPAVGAALNVATPGRSRHASGLLGAASYALGPRPIRLDLNDAAISQAYDKHDHYSDLVDRLNDLDRPGQLKKAREKMYEQRGKIYKLTKKAGYAEPAFAPPKRKKSSKLNLGGGGFGIKSSSKSKLKLGGR